jgi:hypothetical protein
LETKQEITTTDLANPVTHQQDEAHASEREAATDSQGEATDGLRTDDGALAADRAETPGESDKRMIDLSNEADPATSPLFAPDEAQRFRNEWREVQGRFVDEPREAVKHADRLVADLMQRLAAQFSEQRAGLEERWDGQQDVSTEDLRVAMTRYRSFFERLLQA